MKSMLKHYLEQDPSLTEKLTYEEFKEREGRAGNIDDSTIEEAYNAYLRIMNGEADPNGNN